MSQTTISSAHSIQVSHPYSATSDISVITKLTLNV